MAVSTPGVTERSSKDGAAENATGPSIANQKISALMKCIGLSDIDRMLEHLIYGLHDLRVHLEGALRRDHIGHFLYHVHVGALDIALHDATRGALSGDVQIRRTAGVRGEKQVFTHRLQ